jgi:hypothetical protein
MRLISLIGIYSRPVLDIVGISDSAYLHDFTEDDFSARLRRSGYKLMLCRDTWVCHDHDYQNYEDKDPAEFRASLEIGREIFKSKFYGIDAWDDILNFEFALLASLGSHTFPEGKLKALAVDGRCGTPVLEIRNMLKKRGITDIESHGFTTHAKYFLDLQTVCETAVCDRIGYLGRHFEGDYDALVLCELVNLYPEPFNLITDAYGLLKPGGLLLFKLRNVYNQEAYQQCVGLINASEAGGFRAITYQNVTAWLERLGGRKITINMETPYVSGDSMDAAMETLLKANPAVTANNLNEFVTRNYIFGVIKGE